MSIQPEAVTTGTSVQTVFARLFHGWELMVRASLGLSVFLIGVGRIESGASSVSAWSVSRTTFFFWLIGRLFFWWRGGKVWNTNFTELLPFVVFLGAVLVSLVPRFHDLSDFRYLAFAVAHACMVLDVYRDHQGRRLLILALGLIPALILLRGLYETPLVLELRLNYRLGRPLDHPNTAGHLLAMSLPLAVVLLHSERGRLRLVAVVAGLAQLGALLLTYSRGAWLGFASALVFLVVALRMRKELLLFAVLSALLLFSVEPLRQRFLGLFDTRNDQAISDRMVRMRDTLRVGLANPLLGVGYGRGKLKAAIRANPASEIKTNEPIWHGHNIYLELLAGSGLIGLAGYLGLIVSAFRRCWRTAGQVVGDDRFLTFGLTASAIALVVCGIGDVTFHHHETRLFAFTLLALMLLRNAEGVSFGRKKV